MDKLRTKTWQELRDELESVATPDDVQAFDEALASGRKLSAVKLLRSHGISVYED